MKSHKISEKEKRFLKTLRNKTNKVSIYKKISVILFVFDGVKYEVIAASFGISVKTISRYFQGYLQKGVESLNQISKKGLKNHSYLDKEQEEKLKKHLDENLYPNAKSIREHIYKEFGIKYSLSGVTKLLKRLRFSFKKTSVAPVKADKKKQEKFIEEYHQLRQENPNALIYFVDAVHFLHNMISSTAWILIGKEKVLPTNSGRDRINILGAYEPQSCELICLDTLKSCNSQFVIQLFEKIISIHPDKEIILIMDNAKYQHNVMVKDASKELKITLKYLPAYSPNLNLIERLWKFMKKIIVRNQYIDKFNRFVEIVKNFLIKYKDYEKEIKSLITENFQLVYSSDKGQS